jgi:hypothetical protein
LAIALGALLLPASAMADETYLDAPPPLPAPRAPAPARDADEFPRRSWELFPEAGFGSPFCHGASFGAGRCGDSGNGPVFGGSALLRVSPYVAFGATAAFADFHLDETPAPAHSGASFMGLTVRGYFADRGAIDPHVEMGIGRGASTMGYSDGDVEVRSDAAGPSAMGGAGVDFWILPYFKLGPAVSYRWTWLTDVRTCSGGRCERASVADFGAIGSYASLSLNATLALGREM